MWHFERGDFRGKEAEKVLKKGVDKEFFNYVNNIICTNSM